MTNIVTQKSIIAYDRKYDSQGLLLGESIYGGCVAVLHGGDGFNPRIYAGTLALVRR